MYIFDSGIILGKEASAPPVSKVRKALLEFISEREAKIEAQRVADEQERSRDRANEFHELSPMAEETLSDLRDQGRSTTESYSHYYPGEATPRVRLDVAKAMVLSSGRDNRKLGWFDGVAAKAMEIKFWEFARKEFGYFVGPRGGSISFDDLRRGELRPFMSTTEREPSPVDFDFHSKQGRVSLRLSIDGKWMASWELRGLSKLKKSHLQLRDELQKIIADYELRKEWMKDYLDLDFSPGLLGRDIETVRRCLSSYFPGADFDLSLLRTGRRFQGDFIQLNSATSAHLGRCVSCEEIVFLEVVDGNLWHRSVIEQRLAKVLEGVHRSSGKSCRETRYWSELSGEIEEIPSDIVLRSR